MNKLNISLFITLMIFCSVFSIIDSINAIEYFMNADFYNKVTKSLSFIFLITHPIVLYLYYTVSLFYLSWIDDGQFDELTAENEYYEMIYFRHLVKNHWLLIFPITTYMTILSYCKFFTFYSLKFLIEMNNYSVFKNVIVVTLNYSLIIHIVFQTFPQILLQSINNLLIK
jgi:hypothetical protein